MNRLRAGAVIVALVAGLLSALGPGSATAIGSAVPESVAAAEPIPEPYATEVRPLIIVLDTSGSMSEDDGSGTIKLAGAQASLSRMLRQQRPESYIGLWTYPDDGGCSSGHSAIDVGPLRQRPMINQVRGLSANGNTPTGTALQAAVDSVRQTYDGATILLISDGLHTCEPDPCDVAKQIRSDGFDITVQTAGFKISPDGMKELQCIAEATGGRVYEADDADQLGAVVAQATTPELKVRVRDMPVRVPAGAARKVTVDVSNPTAQDVAGAQLGLSFANADGTAAQIVPAALPPRLPLGNLRSGSSTSHTWLVTFGSRGKTGSATYKVSAWGANAQPTSVKGRVEVNSAAQSLRDAGKELSALVGKRIAILGDSYSSGEGAHEYLAGTNGENGNKCHKSESTYLYPLFGHAKVELLACSGATSRRDRGKKENLNGVEEDQVPLLKRRQESAGPVEAAFMTIGGNDIGFGDIVSKCVGGHPTVTSLNPITQAVTWDTRCSDDKGMLDLLDRRLARLPPDLWHTYKSVYDVLNSPAAVRKRGRVAPLYVLSYPQPFPEAQWSYFCKGFDRAEISFANDLVDRLDAAIEKTVQDARSKGYRLRMVSTTQEAFLADNTICPRPGSTAFLNPVSLAGGIAATGKDFVGGSLTKQELVHPNKQGYAVETDAVIAWSTTADTKLPDNVKAWTIGEGSGGFLDALPGWLARVVTPLPAADGIEFDLVAESPDVEQLDIRGGQRTLVRVSGGAPDSEVTLSVASGPQMVGTVVLDSSGRGTMTVTIPKRLVPGTHRLEALGFDKGLRPVVATKSLDVASALPWWLLPTGGATILSAVTGLLLIRRSSKRWRRLTRTE